MARALFLFPPTAFDCPVDNCFCVPCRVVLCARHASHPSTVGPAEALFESAFYRDMRAALAPGGRICTQAESMWLHLDLIKGLFRKTMGLFNNVEYATTQIPTYPGGQIGFLVCAHEPDCKEPLSCAEPAREVSAAMQDQLNFYSPALHRAAFVLPMFVQRAIAEARAMEAAPAAAEE